MLSKSTKTRIAKYQHELLELTDNHVVSAALDMLDTCPPEKVNNMLFCKLLDLDINAPQSYKRKIKAARAVPVCTDTYSTPNS